MNAHLMEADFGKSASGGQKRFYSGMAEGLACADLGARTPISASGNCNNFSLQNSDGTLIKFYERGNDKRLWSLI
jgi:hypothetical protein